MLQTILIIEDEIAIRDMIKFALQATTEFIVVEAESAKEADDIIFHQVPDLILLDWMLPLMSGIKYAQKLKAHTQTQDIPIIMLTAKAEEDNKIKGLEAGADDYITKPFSVRELIARIKTVLRRGVIKSPHGIVIINQFKIDPHAHLATYKDETLALSPIEFRLLYFFATHQERTYSRDQLIYYIWSRKTDLDERTVDVHILRLRKILKKYNSNDYIQTVHGIGYKFVTTPP